MPSHETRPGLRKAAEPLRPRHGSRLRQASARSPRHHTHHHRQHISPPPSLGRRAMSPRSPQVGSTLAALTSVVVGSRRPALLGLAIAMTGTAAMTTTLLRDAADRDPHHPVDDPASLPLMQSHLRCVRGVKEKFGVVVLFLAEILYQWFTPFVFSARYRPRTRLPPSLADAQQMMLRKLRGSDTLRANASAKDSPSLSWIRFVGQVSVRTSRAFLLQTRKAILVLLIFSNVPGWHSIQLN